MQRSDDNENPGAGRAGSGPASVSSLHAPAGSPPQDRVSRPTATVPVRPAPLRPVVAPAADLACITPARRWPALCFVVTFLLYLLFIPRLLLYSSPPTGDQAFYLMVTMSIIQDGDLNVANNYAQRDEDKFYTGAPHPPGFVGMSAPYPFDPLPADSRARPRTEVYDFRMPGLPVLLVPAWVIGSWFSLWWPATVVFMCLVGALVALNIFLLAYELTGHAGIAWAVWLPLAFSNPIMSYSYLLFSELPTALFVLYAFRRLARGWNANGLVHLLLIGVCIGYVPWMSWRCAPIALALALYGAVQWWRAFRAGRSAAITPSAAPAVVPRNNPQISWLVPLVPVALAAGLLAGYNLFLFADLLPPARVPELGDTPPFLWPWLGYTQFTHFVRTGFALLFDRQMGLLPYAPIYLLAGVGVFGMLRSRQTAHRRILFWMAAVALPYSGLIMAYQLWNGVWSPPSRFLTVVTPLLAGPLAISLWALARSRLYKLIYGLLTVPGIFLMAVVMVADPRMLWPGNPVFRWLAEAPASPLRIDVRNFLPAFSPLDERHLPANTAWLTAASLLIVLIGYILVLRAPLWPRLTPRAWAVHGLIGVVLVSTAGAGWGVMNAEYLQHRTQLVEQHRWEINLPLNQPLGIAYAGGKIFLTDFRGPAVGALDTSTGIYRPLPPTLGQAALPLAHPGDIKVSPDNLLYLLNNGPGTAALYVMRPDGQVVRQAALDGKSDVATGLSFGPDGKLYVADMVGGSILKYDPAGGPPLRRFARPEGGFNNITGLAIAGDGTIYAGELGPRRVNAFSLDGHFIRSYDIACIPWYLALAGDWLDVSCDQGIVSINTRTQTIQKSWVREHDVPLKSPTGLAYGPDGLLYVLDGQSISAYQVQH
jgi:hypothetical protein